MSNQAYDDYLQKLKKTLDDQGFNPFEGLPDGGADGVWMRRGFEITKFSLVDTFVFARFVPGAELTTDLFEEWSGGCFEFALKNKNFFPRGFFGMAIAHPLIVTDAIPDPVAAFVHADYCPKHWASNEFAAIYDLSNGHLARFEATPAWGAAYYAGFRKQVDLLFG